MRNKSEDFFLKQIDDPGIEIDENIISSKELKFILSAVKWNFDNLDEEEQDAQNLYNRLAHKKNQGYWTSDKETKKLLHSDFAIQALKNSGELEKNQYILNEVIEYCILDLLKLFFENENIKVFKSSLYDDIKSKIDLIIEWKKNTIWVDITISSNKKILSDKSLKNNILPTEYNIYLWKKTQKNKGKIFIENPKRIERIVLPFEPNLAQIFLNEYIDMIRTEENPEKIDASTVQIAWEESLQRYTKDEIDKQNKWFYKNIEKEDIMENINSVIEETQYKLLTNLI